MKKIYLILACILFLGAAYAQQRHSVQSINSDSAAKWFVINSNYDKENAPEWLHFRLTSGAEWQHFYNLGNDVSEKISQKEQYSKWAKIDLNNDGKPDLIVSGVIGQAGGAYKLLVFLSEKDSDEYTQFDLIPEVEKSYPAYFKEIKSDDGAMLEITHWLPTAESASDAPYTKDTVVYKTGYFLNYNPAPTNDSITKITYIINEPDDSYRKAEFTPRKNGEATGVLWDKFADAKDTSKTRVRIAQDTYIDVLDIIKYANLKSLRSEYELPPIMAMGDVQVVQLTVEYSDGSTKTITDNGGNGTYSLFAIYDWIEEIYSQVYELTQQQQQRPTYVDPDF
jgi:hypothetical protein